jgi:hypothetical protein
MKPDYIERLERLHRLRESGALDDAEFQAEKQKLLGDRRSRPSPWVYVGAALVVVGGAAAVGLWAIPRTTQPTVRSDAKDRRLTPSTRSGAAPSSVSPPAAVPVSGDRDRLAEAFLAATGHRRAFTVSNAEGVITTVPVRIIDEPFGLVLLTKREIKDGCHSCSGSIGVYYLHQQGASLSVAGRWPKAVETVGWGSAPTQWQITDKFTTYPAIYAEGGYTAQGQTESGGTITELRPAAPSTSAWIHTGYSFDGVDGSDHCEIDGRIANIRKDHSFDVILSGSVKGMDHYVMQNGRFVSVSKRDWDNPCAT